MTLKEAYAYAEANGVHILKTDTAASLAQRVDRFVAAVAAEAAEQARRVAGYRAAVARYGVRRTYKPAALQMGWPFPHQLTVARGRILHRCDT